MLELSLHPNLRRMAVAVVLVAYAMPLSVGAASWLGHGAFNLLEQLQERQARAAALGLVHLSDRGTFTHTHDGVTHSHAGAVDALLSAADRTDEEHDAAAPMVELSAHAPATSGYILVALAVSRASRAVDAVLCDPPR